MRLSQQFLHVAVAQVEPEVQPYGVADDLGWEAMATVQGRVDGHPRDPTARDRRLTCQRQSMSDSRVAGRTSRRPL
jgi:hypothetical protein